MKTIKKKNLQISLFFKQPKQQKQILNLQKLNRQNKINPPQKKSMSKNKILMSKINKPQKKIIIRILT